MDVYQCAVRFLALAASVATRMPRGQAELADQLRRASLSIPLNIAEGSGKEGRDAARYYRTARGSALECAAVLDAAEALGLLAAEDLSEEHELVERIVSMLTKMRTPNR